MTKSAQKPLELILARNLLTSVSTPAFLVDGSGTLVFYNEAAAAVLGKSFEDAGQMSAEQWTTAFGPFTKEGSPVEFDDISLTRSVQAGRPAHGTFTIRTGAGEEAPVEASAFPLVGSGNGSSGAMIMFWPQTGNGTS